MVNTLDSYITVPANPVPKSKKETPQKKTKHITWEQSPKVFEHYQKLLFRSIEFEQEIHGKTVRYVYGRMYVCVCKRHFQLIGWETAAGCTFIWAMHKAAQSLAGCSIDSYILWLLFPIFISLMCKSHKQTIIGNIGVITHHVVKDDKWIDARWCC